ncbi:hypothetical protein QFZ49_000221 [Streptomyces turgidiscabies]|uniref:Transposase n=1 Tax=Streptomyces turgidiscabies TaxID=85558 RepID=A0ABU0RED3_9ACTN|nr:hypothetical protein [Streptomyces turgidiscabies]
MVKLWLTIRQERYLDREFAYRMKASEHGHDYRMDMAIA